MDISLPSAQYITEEQYVLKFDLRKSDLHLHCYPPCGCNISLATSLISLIWPPIKVQLVSLRPCKHALPTLQFTLGHLDSRSVSSSPRENAVQLVQHTALSTLAFCHPACTYFTSKYKVCVPQEGLVPKQTNIARSSGRCLRTATGDNRQ
jgi:hypothetical protein